MDFFYTVAEKIFDDRTDKSARSVGVALTSPPVGAGVWRARATSPQHLKEAHWIWLNGAGEPRSAHRSGTCGQSELECPRRAYGTGRR